MQAYRLWFQVYKSQAVGFFLTTFTFAGMTGSGTSSEVPRWRKLIEKATVSVKVADLV